MDGYLDHSLPTHEDISIPTTTFCAHSQYQIEGSIDKLRQSFLQNQLSIVSNGSNKDGFGAGAWIISSSTCYPDHYIWGDIPSPGIANGQDSHRAECAGIFGAISCFNSLLEQWELTQGTIIYGCDNISALRYSFDKVHFPTITGTAPDFDILQSIRQSLLPTITYSWKHVWGHQDAMGKALDFWEQLNVFADQKAHARRSVPTEHISHYVLPHDSWNISLPSGRIYKDLDNTIFDAWSLIPMRKFWCKRQGWTEETFNSVAWTAIHTAGRHVSIQKRHWICKHSVGVCGTNSVLTKW